MFVRLDKNLPEDPSYPADLTALGYKVNENGEFVKISSPNEHFTFFISDNERVNEVHKEAMHIAAREMVAKELAQLGVKEIYLTGKDGAIVEEVKPEEKHLGLFATDLDLLGMKGEVVVIVGEHNQDPGIFAYRVLTRDEGMDKGEYTSILASTCLVWLTSFHVCRLGGGTREALAEHRLWQRYQYLGRRGNR